LLPTTTESTAFAVDASVKNGDDGENVVRELPFGGVMAVCFHDDLHTVLLENVLEHFVCESA
jgi:hypothetical protein